jgi:hypothetical protein
MKTLPRLLILLGLPLSLASLAFAQTDAAPRGPRPGQRPPGGPPLIRALDADHDGEISAGEIASAASSLRVLDTDADGQLSAAELHPPRPANAPTPPEGTARPTSGERPRDPVLAALDTDGDGALSAAEIANAPAALARLDANKDGKLTPEELRPAGAPHHRAQRPKGGSN